MGKHRQSPPSQKHPQSGFIRLISGEWRGRKLPVHHVEGLRPTTDRVKETLFNWLSMEVPSSRCLDLFSGSGSLGFEAASRHAEHVTMLELNPQVFQQLQKNKQTLSASNIDIVQANSLDYLTQTRQESTYDIIFIDPPFRQGLLDEVFQRLEDNHWLTDNAFIYVESEKEWQPQHVPNNWSLHREKIAGQVCYRLYKRDAQPASQ